MKKFTVPFLLLLICASLLLTFPCKAATVWSDNFDDGNYNGWEVANGGPFSAEDHALGSLSDEAGIYGNMIVHGSGVTTGTWSFDVQVGSLTIVFLMYTVIYQQDTSFSAGLTLYWSGRNIQFYSDSDSNNRHEVGNFLIADSPSGWQHFDVTRSSNRRTCVYLNGTLIIDAVDIITIPPSEVFAYTPYGGAVIDNIIVSNTVDIKPPPQVPFYMQTWFLATVGAVLVVIVAAVFLLRRKK